jgi:hypothetical protein
VRFPVAELFKQNWGWLIFVSVIYAASIATNNASFESISLTVNTIFKSAMPFPTLVFSYFIEGKTYSLPILFIVAAWIGFVACGSSLLLLDWALSSEDPDSPMRQLGLSSSLSYGQIIAVMYLKISLSDWWTIFAARTQDWCWTRAPSKIVASAALFATLTSTYFSVTWPFQDIRFDEVLYLEGEEAAREHQEDVQLIGLDFEHVVFTWCFCGVFFVIQDTAKVLCYRVLFHYDVCGIKTDALANEERIAANERIQNGLSHSVTTNPKDILVGIEKQRLLHAGTVQSH